MKHHARGVKEEHGQLTPVAPYWQVMLERMSLHCGDARCERCNCMAKDKKSASFPFAPKWMGRVLGPLEEAMQHHDDLIMLHPTHPDQSDPSSAVATWFAAFGSRKPGHSSDAPGYQAIHRLRRMDRKLRQVRIAEALALWALTGEIYQYMEALARRE